LEESRFEPKDEELMQKWRKSHKYEIHKANFDKYYNDDQSGIHCGNEIT